MKTLAGFASLQAALQASRSVYKATEVIYSGRLDEQIYHPVSAFERLGEYNCNTFVRESSLNSLSSAVSKIAAYESSAWVIRCVRFSSF